MGGAQLVGVRRGQARCSSASWWRLDLSRHPLYETGGERPGTNLPEVWPDGPSPRRLVQVLQSGVGGRRRQDVGLSPPSSSHFLFQRVVYLVMQASPWKLRESAGSFQTAVVTAQSRRKNSTSADHRSASCALLCRLSDSAMRAWHGALLVHSFSM